MNKHTLYLLELEYGDHIVYDEHHMLNLSWQDTNNDRLRKIPVLIREDETIYTVSLGTRRGFENRLRFRIDSDDLEYVNEISHILQNHRYILMLKTDEGMRVMGTEHHSRPVETRVHGTKPSQTDCLAKCGSLTYPYYYARIDVKITEIEEG